MARSNGEEPSALSASQGIPHCFRSKIWPRLSGAYKKQEQAANQQPPLTYADLVHCTNSLSAHVVNQIEKVSWHFM
ncbi:unnamed protein product [Dibothriocephalus latus]|uniref:Rab-GAP TBC domain-containing protein n=1 Tax=Dibothriocephalus latus TaxID=60516 RepID=A0A3P7MPW9_DIBLA|nr:unnamed protein product [Dibothriocephalus latus]